MKRTVTFYREWLPLPKEQFRVLMYLARNGSFSGNLSDLCRYFSLTPQNRNRQNLRTAINALTEEGFIESSLSGRTYKLTLIPKEKEIVLLRSWVDAITSADAVYSVSVSKENVLKVLLWLKDHGEEIFKNEEIQNDLGVGSTTIISAKKVLCEDFGAIIRNYITHKVDEDTFFTEGQIVNISAWLKD